MTWDDLKAYRLTLYCTNWCPDCGRFKKLLAHGDIGYEEIDVDEEKSAREHLVRQVGTLSIPYIELDGRALTRAWHKEVPGNWDEELFFRELEAALGSAALEDAEKRVGD